MPTQIPFRVVIDTNVVFEGVTKQGGACSLIVDAWSAELFRPSVSNALAYEYTEVLSRLLSAERWQKIQPVLGTLLDQTEFIAVYFTWRPSSPDPGDEHVIDCAMNAGATVVTSNVRDFQMAKQTLGLRVITPVEFAIQLAYL
ncbi:PIN domain-containing protein [bacterium]|nr:PIN domain-containing protein [bacterium]